MGGYMDTKEFLTVVLPELTGKEAYHTFTRKNENVIGNVHTTIDSIINKYNNSPYDTYFTVAAFKDASNRKRQNVSKSRTFWIDIDIAKPTVDSYENIIDAMTALVGVVKSIDLRPTAVVSSGNGLHVYWVLSEYAGPELWEFLAGYLLAVLKNAGLKVDSGPTHIASAPRLPGSLNKKAEKRVEIIGWYPRNKLSIYSFASKLKAVMPGFLKKDTEPIDKKEVPKQNFRPINAQIVVDGCKQIANMGLAEYPAWFAAMSVLRCCIDGQVWAHKLSGIHPNYNQKETDDKFASANSNGPTTCATFHEYSPQLCEGCIHRGKITTPAMIPEPAITVVKMNDPVKEEEWNLIPRQRSVETLKFNDYIWVSRSDGIYVRESKDAEETVLEQVCTSQLFYKHTVYEIDAYNKRKQVFIFLAKHPNGKVEECRLSPEDISTAQSIACWAGNNNIAISSVSRRRDLMNYLNAYLKEVMHKGDNVKQVESFGWTEIVDKNTKEKILGFVTEEGIITKKGLAPVALSPMLKEEGDKMLGTSGSFKEWKKVPALYSKYNQKVGELAICLSFAAPLMHFASGDSGNAFFSLWSPETGLGKSQLLSAAASVWGKPKANMVTGADSTVSRGRRLAMWKNLPVFMDEVSNVDERDLYNLAYMVANGEEKHKLQSSGLAFGTTGSWKTCTMATSNVSIKNTIAKRSGSSDATIQRILEYRCDFRRADKDPQMKQDIEDIMDICKRNYGHAGKVFIHKLLQDTLWMDYIKDQALACRDSLRIEQKERFMGASLAMALVAGNMACDFGILSFNMEALKTWVRDVFLPENRRCNSDNRMQPVSILTYFFTLHQNNVLRVVEKVRDKKHYKEPGNMVGAKDRYIITQPPQGKNIYIRIHDKEQQIFVEANTFKTWLFKNYNLHIKEYLEQLTKHGIPHAKKKISLTQSIAKSSPVWCYCINERHLNDLGFDTNGGSLEEDT